MSYSSTSLTELDHCEANYLITFRASVNLALRALILPGISRLLTRRRGMLPAQVDLWIARGSAVYGVIGSTMMGLSASPAALVLCMFSSGETKQGGFAGPVIPFLTRASPPLLNPLGWLFRC